MSPLAKLSSSHTPPKEIGGCYMFYVDANNMPLLGDKIHPLHVQANVPARNTGLLPCACNNIDAAAW